MGFASTRLDRRRRIYDALAAQLAALSDANLNALAPRTGSWRPNVHGNHFGVIEMDGVKVFVKKIALAELERTGGTGEPTANLFDLPDFYHYGVGSAGFGAWRELRAYQKASAWALSGEQPNFPLVYHWRVLPRTPPALSDEQRAWLNRAPDYWNRSDAVRARLDAISSASNSIVLFLEYAPQTLHEWLRDSLTGQPMDAALETKILRFHDQWQRAAAFMNDRGMLHFDLNAYNVLTDGEQVYVADFGLAICADFDLSPSERAFFETHQLYDRCYAAWAFVEWLAPKAEQPVLTPALSSLMDRYAPVANVFRRFLNTLSGESKTAPYPVAALEAALATRCDFH
jgi:Protein tyrosine and serine/threonine kinase